jgi:glycosyltransferase involved in cell wall biosynthesis
MRFGGFIITYNRSEIILQTIHEIFAQSLPPELLWIIDNSDSLETDQAIASTFDSRLKYYRMGYNSGPAGAAVKGLELCFESGMEWIFWGDDNDPPKEVYMFERLVEFAINQRKEKNVGQVGLVGHLFNRHFGSLDRVTDEVLKNTESVSVDNIGGGQMKIVHSSVIAEKITLDSKLFFGFEELDFDINLKKAGYLSLVNGPLYYQTRKKYNRLNKGKSIGVLPKFTNHRIYYSLRNILFILRKNGYYGAVLFVIIKSVFKSIYNFRFGFDIGVRTVKFTYLAILHFIFNKKGNFDQYFKIRL